MIALLRFTTVALFVMTSAHADLLPSSETLQLQQLIQTSEEQLKAAQELVKTSRRDANAVEEAQKSLAKLTAGLDRSIEKFQGTQSYERALLILQTEELKKQTKQKANGGADHGHFLQFQSDSIRANEESLDRVKALEKNLASAESGFVAKIQTQAGLGNWQTSARISAQLSEILASLHSLQHGSNPAELSGLSMLVKGAEEQNHKQREASLNAH